MSSLMDKNKLPGLEARSKMFLRSNSFQKLCSLAHPMRLKGFKSNKEALKSVFESLIVTTRGVIQSVTYRILCFLFLTPFSKLVSEPLAAVGKDGRFQTVRLFLKLTLSMIVSTADKPDPKCDNGRFDCSAEPEPIVRLADCVDTAVQTDPPASEDADDFSVDQFFDCTEDTPTAASAKPPTEELLRRLRFPPAAQSTPLGTPKRNRLSLRLTVYACVVGCFLQLSVLAYLLHVAATIPPGLVFLISAVGYIGYVLMRITFNQCSRLKSAANPLQYTKAPTTTTTTTTTTVALVKPRRKESTVGKGIHPILAAVSKQVASVLQSRKTMMMVPVSNGSRMSRCDLAPRCRSRPSTRALLCTDDKTISKIKLL